MLGNVINQAIREHAQGSHPHKLGTTAQTVSKWWGDQTSPDRARWPEIEHVLGFEAGHLARLEGHIEPAKGFDVGESSRRFSYPGPPAAALEAVRGALERVGRRVEVDELTTSASASVRIGLQTVRVRASVLPAGETSVVELSGASDDLWGGGARRACDKVVAALSS